ncbi:glutathione S-transferase family protein [Pseudohoeflea coraliihabitans]|uniref:Glutathione S-transferase family protein n=1 Tax=Pseudohoeflea coraliihabitans TaxID=2860393 RepID=A0ABS6WRX3_9HYPH|nr:glutathione S-transferase family protein [Pseudohoeflea sp. DP4N28-3]MBW3098723.1 glutathione S-transferase family protein [Pseudohoeflea sp. DP4N28-3]
MTLKLYTLSAADTARPFSPHGWKAVLALHHKGLAFEEIQVPFTRISEIANGAAKTVPVLIDGETIVTDSFAIAEHLEAAYPDRPSLFGGEGGRAMARFIERWSQTATVAALVPIILKDVHSCVVPEDKAYFRQSREARFGMTLEEVVADRQAAAAAYPSKLDALRHTLKFQLFIGGEGPLFADHIVFGCLQWARLVRPQWLLPAGDPVNDWFERCLDLYGGVGRSAPAAA